MTETSDEELRDLFEVADSISKQVEGVLVRESTNEKQRRSVRHDTNRSKAYQLYRWGRFYRDELTEDGLKKAIASFKQAIEIDPTYAKPYAGLADCYILLGMSYLARSKQAFEQAKTWALKGKERDETLASVHTTLAFVSMFSDYQWDEAERGFRRAIELSPNHATAHQGYAHLLTALGRYDEALAEITRALELNPTSLIINIVKGIILYEARQYEQSLRQFEKTLELNPHLDMGYYGLALIYEQQKRYDEAIAASRKAIIFSRRNPLKLMMLAHVYVISGAKAEAQKVLNRLTERYRYVSPFHMALIYAALNDADQAFDYLNQAIEENDQWMVLVGVEPRLDTLRRSDPRFKKLLQDMRLPASQET